MLMNKWCSWGQHLVLLLNGTHNAIRHSLPLQFTVENRNTDGWRGRAIIPLDYLPPRVTRMNAYAIHGSDSCRIYEALYPTPTGMFPNPDLYSICLYSIISFIINNNYYCYLLVWQKLLGLLQTIDYWGLFAELLFIIWFLLFIHFTVIGWNFSNHTTSYRFCRTLKWPRFPTCGSNPSMKTINKSTDTTS